MSRAILIRLTLIAGLLAAGATTQPWWTVGESVALEDIRLLAEGDISTSRYQVVSTGLAEYQIDVSTTITHVAEGDRDPIWPTVIVEITDGDGQLLAEEIAIVEPESDAPLSASATVAVPCPEAGPCTQLIEIALIRADDARGEVTLAGGVYAAAGGSGDSPEGAELALTPVP
jgi:hypothetical protein